jgi:hypothetical protein
VCHTSQTLNRLGKTFTVAMQAYTSPEVTTPRNQSGSNPSFAILSNAPAEPALRDAALPVLDT